MELHYALKKQKNKDENKGEGYYGCTCGCPCLTNDASIHIQYSFRKGKFVKEVFIYESCTLTCFDCGKVYILPAVEEIIEGHDKQCSCEKRSYKEKIDYTSTAGSHVLIVSNEKDD